MIRLRYRNVILGGIFAGLAGAYLTLEQSGSFQNGMTSGRGFIALAAVIFGRWTPIGAFGGGAPVHGLRGARVAIRSPRRRATWATSCDAIPPAVLWRAALSRDAHRPGGRRRTERRAGGRRPAVRRERPRRPDRAGSIGRRAITERRREARAHILDLQEGRGPVAVLDDDGIDRRCCDERGGSRSWAHHRTRAGRRTA